MDGEPLFERSARWDPREVYQYGTPIRDLFRSMKNERTLESIIGKKLVKSPLKNRSTSLSESRFSDTTTPRWFWGGRAQASTGHRFVPFWLMVNSTRVGYCQFNWIPLAWGSRPGGPSFVHSELLNGIENAFQAFSLHEHRYHFHPVSGNNCPPGSRA
jgi:hypothetical protein